MTDEELAAIQGRCEAATTGPWTPEAIDYGDHWNEAQVLVGGKELASIAILNPEYEGPRRLLSDRCIQQAHANATFIAHARTDIPALLADLDRLRTGVREVAEDMECKGLSAALGEYDIPPHDIADFVRELRALLEGREG